MHTTTQVYKVIRKVRIDQALQGGAIRSAWEISLMPQGTPQTDSDAVQQVRTVDPAEAEVYEVGAEYTIKCITEKVVENERRNGILWHS